MSSLYVVVESLKDWKPYYSSQDLIQFEDYLSLPANIRKKARVINLCQNYRYLSRGYYCSLLAEARGQKVIPSVQVLNDLSKKSLYLMQLEEKSLQQIKDGITSDSGDLSFRIYFGQTEDASLRALGRQIFERFPAPILEVELNFQGHWQLRKVRCLGLSELEADAQQQCFAEALERFSQTIWRTGKKRKRSRFDLAILYDPAETLPPSDSKALELFIRSAGKLGIAAELITRKDYSRLAEFDGLFIRETTAIDHHTYRFARKAETEGLVVMDDPESILRCTNKVFLADLLRVNKVPTPSTRIISDRKKTTLDELEQALAYPMVLKIPDGSFSRGVVKVDDRQALQSAVNSLMKKSALILAQEFMYTDYDWRIGVLNNRPIFACRYYMVKDHWQIYQHGGDETASGRFDTLPTYEVPSAVLDVAMKACRLIGNGLYGVDIKQKGDQAFVIEVNDNPSIDSDVEDAWLKDELYMLVMQEFLHRMEKKASAS